MNGQFPGQDFNLQVHVPVTAYVLSRFSSQIGKIGGAATTTAKKEASRKNGKLGGRPRKPKGLATAR